MQHTRRFQVSDDVVHPISLCFGDCGRGDVFASREMSEFGVSVVPRGIMRALHEAGQGRGRRTVCLGAVDTLKHGFVVSRAREDETWLSSWYLSIMGSFVAVASSISLICRRYVQMLGHFTLVTVGVKCFTDQTN